MKPPVTSRGKFKRQVIVLVIVLADINIISIRRNIMKRVAFRRHLFIFAPAHAAFDKPIIDQFLFDLYKVFFLTGNIKCSQDGVQMFKKIFCFRDLGRDGLKCPFELIISVKIMIRVFRRGERGIDRYTDFFAIVVIGTDENLILCSQLVAVRMDQFAVYFKLVPLFRIRKLFFLYGKFLLRSFPERRHMFPQFH